MAVRPYLCLLHQCRNASPSPLPSLSSRDKPFDLPLRVNADPRPSSPTFLRKNLKLIQSEIVRQLSGEGRLPLPSQPAASSTQTSLLDMARFYFERGGKLFRPTVALLMASACNLEMGKTSGVTENQYRIAMICEMMHVASLVHDDVIDESSTRRGGQTVNAKWGNKMAVLAGDFILARATQLLCSIRDPDVISVMASIIEDLVVGEFMQMAPVSRFVPSPAPIPLSLVPSSAPIPSGRMDEYMAKTTKKTASLFENSCRSVAMLAGCSSSVQSRAAEYGNHLGLAFQLVDDLLDFVATDEELGKPAASDLRQGLATGPLLFACETFPRQLEPLLERKFQEKGDVELARDLVLRCDAVERTRQLAEEYARSAADIANSFPQSDGSALMLADLARKQVQRKS